jgi:hypothetical protein
MKEFFRAVKSVTLRFDFLLALQLHLQSPQLHSPRHPFASRFTDDHLPLLRDPDHRGATA